MRLLPEKHRELPGKDAQGRARRVAVEGGDVCARPWTIGAQRPPFDSPEPYARAWRADEFNPETKQPPHRPEGRCNREANECVHWSRKTLCSTRWVTG